jgi:8-oxo-dGTP pyrophosphatase MutT (NUDIX family)
MIAPAAGPYPQQFAALPFKIDRGQLLVMLVTSRETKRWVIPKGWPMKGKKPHAAAALEAREEAGVLGSIRQKPLGTYIYWKRLESHFVLCEVIVFLLAVTDQLANWREKGQRDIRWFTPEEAADLVEEPGLGTLIRGLRERLAP